MEPSEHRIGLCRPSCKYASHAPVQASIPHVRFNLRSSLPRGCQACYTGTGIEVLTSWGYPPRSAQSVTRRDFPCVHTREERRVQGQS